MPVTQSGPSARAEFHAPYNDVAGNQINNYNNLPGKREKLADNDDCTIFRYNNSPFEQTRHIA